MNKDIRRIVVMILVAVILLIAGLAIEASNFNHCMQEAQNFYFCATQW